MKTRAFICGCQGLFLSDREKVFLQTMRPWGFIIFARNVKTPEQVSLLISEVRHIIGAHAPIFIDQEGGRVQRLKPPLWPQYPPARIFADIENKKSGLGLRAAWLGARLLAWDLHQLGINVNCLPVLDVPTTDSSDVIGDRAYGKSPNQVSQFGRVVAEGLMAGGVLPVIKHLPGHGRALVDSHHALAVVRASLEQLRQSDFAAFKPLAHLPIGMSAHIVYEAIDADNPATISTEVVAQIIREEIGFGGLLLSDDISMKALTMPMGERAQRALAAGCDIVLHCNGDLSEMQMIAANVPELSGVSLQRAQKALQQQSQPDYIDEKILRDEFEHLLYKVGWKRQ